MDLRKGDMGLFKQPQMPAIPPPTPPVTQTAAEVTMAKTQVNRDAAKRRAASASEIGNTGLFGAGAASTERRSLLGGY